MEHSNQSFFSKFLVNIKEVLIRNNPKKIILTKAVAFPIIFFIVLLIVFLVRNRFALTLNGDQLNHSYTQIIETNGFINIVVSFNTGIAFGNLANNPAAAFSLQSIVMIMILIWLLYAPTIDYIICLSFIVSGAFANIMDRATSAAVFGPNVANAVLDYLQFWFGGAIFNFADSCIVIGFIAVVIAYIVRTIMKSKKDAQQQKQKEATDSLKPEQATLLNKKEQKIDHDIFA